MARKFNGNDRNELVSKISQKLSITLTSINKRYKKLYEDENGNIYCIFNGGLWHSIYETMFKELLERPDKEIFIILGTLAEQNTNVKVYKGPFLREFMPEITDDPEIGKQHYLKFKISGNEAILDQQPKQGLQKIFEYEPSGDFIDSDGLQEYKESIILVSSSASEELQPAKREKNIRKPELDYFCSDNQIQEMLHMLAKKKNVILQGPPGVGKSFIAKGIAALYTTHESSQACMVQFHQAYGYEEFIRGWKPVDSGGFALKDGVFKQFCDKASKAPHKQFVFIIDEINRGNLSRIFGEAMLLIESDKRHQDYAVELAYQKPGETPFFIPDNMHLIGMMNTADRSLAMVDYALRRRFVFFNIEPAFMSEKFQMYLVRNGVSKAMLTKIIERMEKINFEIRKDLTSLGAAYQIGHSYFCPTTGDVPNDLWYQRIIQYEIEPLLREYWFDKPDKVDEAVAYLTQPL